MTVEPKLQFDKNKKTTKKRSPRPITKTDISKPKETYTPDKVNNTFDEQMKQQKPEKRRVGRPKSGRKIYQTVRLQKETVLKINALENSLSIKTQDETVDQAIDRLLRSLSTDEMRSYKLWLEMFKKKKNGLNER